MTQGNNFPSNDQLPPTSELLKNGSEKSGIGHFKLWIRAFTRFHQIPVFERVWVYVALTATYTIVVHFLLRHHSSPFKDVGNVGYVSVILGVLLVFRTNAAYERWSEGRRVWGQLTNDSRNLALKVRHFARVPQLEKQEFGELIVSFAFALKHHLRDSTLERELPGMEALSELSGKNLPVHIAERIYGRVSSWHSAGKMDMLGVLQLDPHLRAFMDIVGSCERIRSTPLALSYRAFMRQGIAINLALVPFYINPGLEVWWKLPIVMLGAYFLIGLEMIAEDIEDPFGKDGDDLPLDNICHNILKTVHEILPGPVGSLEAVKLKYTMNVAPRRLDPLKPEG